MRARVGMARSARVRVARCARVRRGRRVSVWCSFGRVFGGGTAIRAAAIVPGSVSTGTGVARVGTVRAGLGVARAG